MKLTVAGNWIIPTCVLVAVADGFTPGLSEIYLDAIGMNFRPEYPNTPPDGGRRIGDFGTIDKKTRHFIRRGNIRKFGLEFDEGDIQETKVKPEKSFQSKAVSHSLVGATAGVDVANMLGADLGLKIEFGKAHDVFFLASGVTHRELKDLVSLERELRSRMDCGDWKREWKVVTGITQAKRLTVAVSASEDNELLLKVKTTIPLHEATGLPVVVKDAGIALQTVKKSKGMLEITPEPDPYGKYVPLMNLFRFEKTWVRQQPFNPRIFGVSPFFKLGSSSYSGGELGKLEHDLDVEDEKLTFRPFKFGDDD